MNYEKFKIDLVLTVGQGHFEKFVPEQVDINIINLFSKLSSFKLILLRLVFALRKKLNVNSKYHNAQLHWKTYGNYIDKINKDYDIAIAYNQGLATYLVAEKMRANKKLAWLNIDYSKAGYNINFDIDKYKVFDKVVAVSNECEQSFLTELNNKEYALKTMVIKDITDINIVNKLSQEHSGLKKEELNINICSVGRLAHQKGWHLAIEALYILKQRNRNIKWYIIGEGPKRKELEYLIKKKQLEKNMILLGYKENPYPYIKSCDIYAQTSLFEGLGLTVIEAAILQKPIVTTNFPTSYSIIENEITGLICNMNPLDIAKSIERYLNNPELNKKIVKNLSLLKNNDKEISLNKVNDLLSH